MKNKGDLWKIPISQFHFSEGCISKSKISQVALHEDGDDGWNIESIITMLDEDLLTVDFHVNRWVEGDAKFGRREFILRKV